MSETPAHEEAFSREQIKENLITYANSLDEDRDTLVHLQCDDKGMPSDDGEPWGDWVAQFLEDHNDGSEDSYRKIVEYAESLEAAAVKANDEGDKERLKVLMLVRNFPYPGKTAQAEAAKENTKKSDKAALPEEPAKEQQAEASKKPEKKEMIERFIDQLFSDDSRELLRHSRWPKDSSQMWIEGFIQYLEREVDGKTYGPNLFSQYVTTIKSQYEAIGDSNDKNRKFLKAQHEVMEKVLKTYPKATNEFGPGINKALGLWAEIKAWVLTFHGEVSAKLGFSKSDTEKGEAALAKRSADNAKKQSASEFLGLVPGKEA